MPNGAEFDYRQYDEDLVPARVTLVRQRGNIAIELEVEGFIGSRTGERYYSRDTVLLAEQLVSEVEEEGIGIILSFSLPRVLLLPREASTNDAITETTVGSTFNTREFSFGT